MKTKYKKLRRNLRCFRKAEQTADYASRAEPNFGVKVARLAAFISRRFLGTVFLSCLVMPSIVNVAAAADPSAAGAANEDRAVLEELVVTAQKREQSSIDVPIAISALTEAQLEKLNLTSTYDLSLTTPGFVTASQAGNSIPFLRGVGSTIAFTGSDSSVSTYVDGFYISYDQGTMQELYDAARVEVLKGPQATLYGRNAVGGAINYISLEPDTKEWTGKVGVGYGSDSEKDLKFYLSGPLTDTLAASVALTGRRRNTYLTVEASPPGMNTKESLYAGRVKLLWHPSENYQAELSASFSQKASFEDSVYIPVRGSSLEAVAVGAPVTYADTNTYLTGSNVRNDIHQKGIYLTQTLNFNAGMIFRSLTGFTVTTQNADIPLAGSALPILSVGDYNGLGSREGSQEFQLLSSPDGIFTWILGTSYYQAREGTHPGYTYLPLASEVLGLYSTEYDTATQITKSAAGYGEGTFHATDRLSVILGARLTWDERRLPAGQSYNVFEGIPNPSPFFDCTQAGLTFGVNCGGAALGLPPIPPAYVGAGTALNGVIQPIPESATTWVRPTYKGTVAYKLADFTNAYFSYSRGYKSGVYNLPALATTGNQAVAPETLKAYELGLKTEFFDRRVRVETAVFDYTLDGTQAQVLTGGGTGGQATLTSAGESKIRGAEAELSVAATRRLDFTTGFAYLHSRYEDFSGYPAAVPENPGGGTTGAGGNGTVRESVIGNPIVYTPKWTANATASYKLPIEKLLGGGSLTTSGIWSWTDTYCLEEACRGRDPAYHIVNAIVTYKTPSEHWSVSAYGNNLLNAKYFVNYLQLSTGDFGRYAQLANYGARFEYSF